MRENFELVPSPTVRVTIGGVECDVRVTHYEALALAQECAGIAGSMGDGGAEFASALSELSAKSLRAVACAVGDDAARELLGEDFDLVRTLQVLQAVIAVMSSDEASRAVSESIARATANLDADVE